MGGKGSGKKISRIYVEDENSGIRLKCAGCRRWMIVSEDSKRRYCHICLDKMQARQARVMSLVPLDPVTGRRRKDYCLGCGGEITVKTNLATDNLCPKCKRAAKADRLVKNLSDTIRPIKCFYCDYAAVTHRDGMNLCAVHKDLVEFGVGVDYYEEGS